MNGQKSIQVNCWQPWLQHANYSEVVCSLTAMRPPPTTSSCFRASLGDVVCFPVSLHKLTNPIRRRHKIPFTTWTQRVRTGPIYDPHLQKLNSDPLLSHSVSWLCRTLSSTSLKSISRDPLWRSECCSSRCYLWVSSVQSNTTLVTEITTMSSSSTDSLHHPWSSLWSSAVCVNDLSGGMDRVWIDQQVDLLSCVSRRFSVVFLY